MTQVLLIGLGAGAASALLFASLASGQPFAIGLFYLTPLPILLAGIAWNHLAGLVAAASAAVMLGSVLGGWFLITFLIGIAVPAYVLAYLGLLARPAANGGGETVEWYPPGRLVLAAALLAAAATAISIPAFGLDIDSYRGGLKAAFERILRAQTGAAAGTELKLPGVENTSAFLDFLTVVIPPAAAVLSMVTILANLWLAGRIALISGRLARPWPDLSAMTFPNGAALLLVAGIAGSFLPNLLGLVAALFGATLLIAWALLGFAVLHGITRGMAARALMLSGAWVAVLIFGWPLLLIALIGLIDPILNLRARRLGGGPPAVPPPSGNM